MKTPTQVDIEALARAGIPDIVRGMGELATKAATKPTSRLNAVALLLRVAESDHAAGVDARIHLARAHPYLVVIRSAGSARTASRAAKLAERIANLGQH
jgi:hypothetical protein